MLFPAVDVSAIRTRGISHPQPVERLGQLWDLDHLLASTVATWVKAATGGSFPISKDAAITGLHENFPPVGFVLRRCSNKSQSAAKVFPS